MERNKDYESRIRELEEQLAASSREIKNLTLAVRAENLKVKIASEYTNFGLWEYDIAEDISYQYKKLNGIYESFLDPIVNFRETIISWGSVYVDDIPVFHKFCDAMERGDKEICYDVRVINDFSDIVWFRYEGKTIFDERGIPVRVVGRTLDVTEEKGGIGINTDDRRDKLTGALVYDTFIETVNKRVSEKVEKSSALIVVGIDRFEELTQVPDLDMDHIQQSLAKILEGQSAVEQGSAYSRIKDGLFALYVRFSDIPNLNTIASRLVFRFHDFRFHDSASGNQITVSAGVSIFKVLKSYDIVYTEACAALNAARAKGGKGFLQYNASMPLVAEPMLDGGTEGFEDVVGAVGAEKFYHCVNLALTDEANGVAAMKQAICLAGDYVKASRILLYHFAGGETQTYLPWSADGETEYNTELPVMLPKCSRQELIAILKKNRRIVIAANRNEFRKQGFEFVNGAEAAICYPITGMNKDEIAGYFTVISDSAISWQNSDMEVLDMLSGALNFRFGSYYKERYINGRMRFASAVISDLSIEGFTIDPETFEVDYIGENAALNYGLKLGDVCYKKARGKSRPCEDCPVQLLKAGLLSASTAYFRESDSHWINIAASVYETEDGRARYAISTSDITGCINKIQTRDSLTGVMGFDRFAVDAMRLTAQNPDGGFIVVISIANFRRLNETKGYENGNTVLIATADILQSALSEGELLCRSEGGRFVALYRNTSSDELYTRLNQMFHSAQRQVEERSGLQVYFLAGAYELTGESSGIMSALDRAILAQKTVKHKAYYTSNLIALYDSTMRDELQMKQYIETHMVEALENNEFKVFYQPKVSTETGEIVGAEALVRWIRPDGEIISPGKFVPVFEQNGFVADMDFAIYRRAVSDIKRWIRRGIEVPLISLNVSRYHMRDEGFPDKICSLVDNLGVSRHMIELEITESMLTENLSKLLDVMTRLKEAGFKISVDDFGSGYSSLNLITLLPFDTLKIDGGFFLRNELTEKNKAVITSVVELAKNLSLSTVSEGVETDEQVSFLRELGCDMIQGYYYYKPMPVKNFEEILRQHA